MSSVVSKPSDWIIFLVTTAIMIAMIVLWPEWFWLMLPFVVTYLVKALGMM